MNANVMIVEDEGLVAMQIKEYLDDLGYTVPAVTSTGEEAVTKALSIQPDLVLMDIRLKGDIDGIQAASEIAKSSNIPIIFLTAYSDENTLSRAELTSPANYILKPLESKTLEISIRLALCRSRISNELKPDKVDGFDSHRKLAGILPICANCKKIRSTGSQWIPIDLYIRNHSDIDFTHTICPECFFKLYPEAYKT